MLTEEKRELQTDVQKKNIAKYVMISFGLVCSLLLFFSLLLLISSLWYISNYGETGFDSVLFTIFCNLKGTNNALWINYLMCCVLPSSLVGALLIFFAFVFKTKKGFWIGRKFVYRVLTSLILSVVLLCFAGTKVNLFGYIHKMMHQTTLYEDYYIEPDETKVTFPEQKRNLVYIILESMETTYMSEAQGGVFRQSLMPELTALAEENINFSHTDGVGGFLTPTGTGWTVAAMVAQTSGVPLKGSAGVLENNKYGEDEFLPGVTSLSDILHHNGYNQALVVGSDSSFANRRVYYLNHNTNYVYDLETAKEEGFVVDDYYVWWGMEDELTYDYAKEKISYLSSLEEPFALTLLTADTHFPDGYVCSLCTDKNDEQYSNVISCASHQVESFVNWLKEQEFFDNTTVVICGDHLSMDYRYIQRNVPENYDRRVYNCFLNSAAEPSCQKNRTFTSLDIFPSVLASMGCKIEGDRLGLGTNLFSDKKTLSEEFGYSAFDHELLYSSKFYIKNFMVR